MYGYSQPHSKMSQYVAVCGVGAELVNTCRASTPHEAPYVCPLSYVSQQLHELETVIPTSRH